MGTEEVGREVGGFVSPSTVGREVIGELVGPLEGCPEGRELGLQVGVDVGCTARIYSAVNCLIIIDAFPLNEGFAV